MAIQKFHDATGKMTQLYRKIIHVNLRWSIADKVTVLRRFFRLVWQRVLVCSVRMPNSRYRRLSTRRVPSSSSPPPPNPLDSAATTSSSGSDGDDSDLVSLKISILGDCEIGKTSFVVNTQSIELLFLSICYLFIVKIDLELGEICWR